MQEEHDDYCVTAETFHCSSRGSFAMISDWYHVRGSVHQSRDIVVGTTPPTPACSILYIIT
jgi:hypothetical protein